MTPQWTSVSESPPGPAVILTEKFCNMMVPPHSMSLRSKTKQWTLSKDIIVHVTHLTNHDDYQTVHIFIVTETLNQGLQCSTEITLPFTFYCRNTKNHRNYNSTAARTLSYKVLPLCTNRQYIFAKTLLRLLSFQGYFYFFSQITETVIPFLMYCCNCC